MEQTKQINPAVKQWLNNVLVPAMVRQYLAGSGEVGDNGLSEVPHEDSKLIQEDVQ